jgi:hypothetical protein
MAVMLRLGEAHRCDGDYVGSCRAQSRVPIKTPGDQAHRPLPMGLVCIVRHLHNISDIKPYSYAQRFACHRLSLPDSIQTQIRGPLTQVPEVSETIRGSTMSCNQVSRIVLRGSAAVALLMSLPTGIASSAFFARR